MKILDEFLKGPWLISISVRLGKSLGINLYLVSNLDCLVAGTGSEEAREGSAEHRHSIPMGSVNRLGNMGVEMRACTTRMQNTISRTTDLLFEITCALMEEHTSGQNEGGSKCGTTEDSSNQGPNRGDTGLKSESQHPEGFSNETEVIQKLDTLMEAVGKNRQLLEVLVANSSNSS